jgi:hypothetical protein
MARMVVMSQPTSTAEKGWQKSIIDASVEEIIASDGAFAKQV